MDAFTEVWISNWGQCANVRLDRVLVEDWAVYLYGKLDE